jgi:hypothetical protein
MRTPVAPRVLLALCLGVAVAVSAWFATDEPGPATDDAGAVILSRAHPPERRPTGDITEVKSVSDSSGTTYSLYNLHHRSAAHDTPDAIVRILNGFDPHKPIHLIIYNHGWYTDVTSAYGWTRLEDQTRNMPANSVLIIPEWQSDPGAANGNQGSFGNSGLFAAMVQDAFNAIPALQNKTIDDVTAVSILSHSGGYKPAEAELYNNGIEDKVVCIALLDALYDLDGFDAWLKANVKQLSTGEKRFYNFFYDTSSNSHQQAKTLKKMLTDAGLSATVVFEDYQNADKVMDPAVIAGHSIVFKYSTVQTPTLTQHFAIPATYVEPVVDVP